MTDEVEKRPPDAQMPPLAPLAETPSVRAPGPLAGSTGDALRSGGSWGPTPMMTNGMTFREVGSSGLRAFSGWVREEFLQALVGRQGAQKYREMMDNSPVIGAIMLSITSTMRKVEWRVNPADDSAQAREAAEFVEGCMDDMSHTWLDLIAENLSMIGYGYAPHEIVYKRRSGREPGPDPDRPGKNLPISKFDDGKIGWRRIPLRGQDTVLKWFFDENGGVEGMTQQPWTGPIIDLPIEKMLLFRPSAHKNNPEGRSVLRNSYVPYWFVKRMQEQEAIVAERLGGIPEITVPLLLIDKAAAGDPDSVASLNNFKRMATNIRIDEQMGLVLPSDVYIGANGPTNARMYGFRLVAPEGGKGSFEFDKTITRYKVDMLTSAMADFLQLGHESRGTQSLAVSKVDMFFQAIEGWLNSIAEIYNRFAIPRLWKLNAMDEDMMPRIEPDLAQRIDLDVLSNFVLRLSQAGMPLFPNEDIQSYILDAAGLPDIDDHDLAMQAAGLLPEQLDREDEKADAALERMKNPPAPGPGAFGGQPPGARPAAAGKPGGEGKGDSARPNSSDQRAKDKQDEAKDKPPGGRSNLDKMILAGLAKRMVRHAGPRFGISTQTHKGHRRRRGSIYVNRRNG